MKNALIKSLNFLHKQVDYFMDQSTTDPLTGLSNRRTLDVKMDELITSNTSFSIILMDIDHFKLVNDTYGHGIGDEVLQYLALSMKAVTRSTDLCCRYGGEEFIILLPNTTMQGAFEIAEFLRMKLENTSSPTGNAITVSAGIAEFPTTETTSAKLIEIADQCLYEAKNKGRNQVIISRSLNPTV